MVFIGMIDRTSGMIRGYQMSKAIPNSYFFDIKDVSKVRNIKNEIVIFVRVYDEECGRILKGNNCVIGFDLLDRLPSDKYFRNLNPDYKRYDSLYIDFFIVNNTITKNEFKNITKKKIYVIPHHHINIEKQKNKINRINSIGYIGLPEQLDCYDKIYEYCKKKNITFISKHPNTLEECIEVHKKIDLGIIFLENNNEQKN
jgi:hypothetical protein